uniref:Integrase catalytic domain-containing protein n=1 Tax=Fagus sylvatica TaxID=28930 RepID=A0A2N9GRJ3_FAGSY
MIANPLAVSAFLGILISEFLFDSKQPSLDRSHQDLSIATKIGRIQPRTRPHAPPEVSGSPATRARAPTRRPAPPRALTRSHAPHAPHACFFAACHVSPSDVTLTSALVTSAPRMGSTSGHEITHPITVILDGPASYHAWSQNMTVFLKGRRLWRYQVVQVDDFEARLEEWESIQCRILSWFINTSVPAISSLLPRLETGQAAWSFLATRYNCTYDFALEFHIEVKLYQMRQESGQSISDYYSQTASMWEQLAAADPPLRYAEDIDLFAKYKDRRRFTQFMMGLREDFEPTRAALLSRSPLPSLDAAVKELISEENRRPHHHLSSSDVVLATPRPPSSSDRSRRFCTYCQKPGHDITECYRKKKDDKRKQHQSRGILPLPQAAAVSSAPVNDPVVTVSQLESMFHRYMSQPSPALSVTPGNKSWLLDSACCNHMTPHASHFSQKTPLVPSPIIYTADSSHMSVSHIGTISSPDLTIPDTYLVPKLSLNLLSVGQLCELGLDLHFSNHGVDVQDPLTGKLLGTGRKTGRLFELCNLQIPSHMVSSSVAATTTLSPDLWHSRLGHASLSRLQLLASQGHLGSVNFNKFDCMSCQFGKQTKLPFNNSDSFSSAPFDLVHSDVWGPAPFTTEGGSRYFVIFVDDYSRFTWIYLLKHRSDLVSIFQTFHKMIQTQFSRTIKVFRSDNAQEYHDKSFLSILDSNGTLPHYSCPYTSQQNGRAERKLRHILDVVRTLLISASIPERFWGEAALTAVYTINRIPSPTTHKKSPFELLYDKIPDYSSLRVFGCVCFVSLPSHERNKLEPRSRLCCFLGYGISQKGFRCYDPISRRLRISRHVEFWEHQTFSSRQHFPFISSSMTPIFTDPSIDLYPDPVRDSTQPPSSSDVPSLVLSPAAGSPDSDPASSAPSESPTDIRRSTRVRAPPSHLSDYHCYFALATLHEPHTYREASTNPLWQQAMADELDALHKTHTWDMTTLPPGKSAVGCKWVYKIKTRADGSVERYKARLVARGFTQEYGIDYEETFAPVARLTSVRSLLAVAAVRHWPLFQMDVKNAFLNGDLLEEVYMQPPPGYPDSQNQVCRLRRALYGLKQAPRAWFAKFSSVVAQQGFTPSSYDSALFIRHTSTGITLILLYVDDMIITGDDTAGICDLQKFLSQQFEMKDLGTLSYFLGLEVTSSSDGYYLSQAKYASDLLSKAGLTDSKTVSTPLELNVKLNTTDGEPLSDATLYRQLVGSLIYLTVTRPDLAYAVHLVSQFMSAPRSTHYAAVLRILRYIKGTLFHGLHFSAQSSLELRAYADADWAGDPTDRRSTTGYCFLLGSSLISWRSKKQSVVARSSTEAEYRALADATSELLWLRWLLADMGAPQTTSTPIHCDNRSAIHIAHNDVFHERTKHIEIDCHFIRHHLQQSALHLLSVSSEDQLADVFTKSHPPGRLRDLVSKLKMASSSPPCV